MIQEEKKRALFFYLGQGPQKAEDLCKRLGISQPTFSRLVKSVPQVKKRGKARQTCYFLLREDLSFSPFLKVYEVNKEGVFRILGEIFLVMPEGFLWCSSQEKQNPCYLKSLPFFMQDLRPTGFLGRKILSKYKDEFLAHPQFWSELKCLEFYEKYGFDLFGGILVGEKVLSWYMNHSPVFYRSCEKESLYQELCEKSLNLSFHTSSIGGEQPKFLCAFENQGYFMVKYSPPFNSDIGRRIRDLLICEHLALEFLATCGFSSCSSSLVWGEKRCFLEIKRFDRTLKGRRSVLSLNTLDGEFVGDMCSWSQSSKMLLEQNKISKEDYENILFLEVFSEFIGNNDRHFFNISFYPNESYDYFELTPFYDVLPMYYMPKNGEIVSDVFKIKIFIVPKKIYQKAFEMAISYWECVEKYHKISESFQKIAANMKKEVLKYKEVIEKMS